MTVAEIQINQYVSLLSADYSPTFRVTRNEGVNA